MPVTSRLARARRSLRQRPHVPLVATIPAVLGIVAVKLAIDRLGWEFISFSPLQTSSVAGALFILGLVLVGNVSAYKEVERLRIDRAAALQSIYREGAYVKALYPEFNLTRLAETLAHIPPAFRDDLVDNTQHNVATMERLTESYLEMEEIGVAPEYIARLKHEQGSVIRNLMRVSDIHRSAVLRFASTLIKTVVAVLIVLLLFTRVDRLLTDIILLGFIAFVSLYVLRLLRIVDTPSLAAGTGADGARRFKVDAIHEEMHARLDEQMRGKNGQPANRGRG